MASEARRSAAVNRRPRPPQGDSLPEAASLCDVSGGRARSGSARPHLARSRPALLLPSARPAPGGCWPPRAFSCRARRPTRFPGDRTGCPTGGTGPGARVSGEPLGHCRLAWHPPYLLRASPSSQHMDPEPGALGESPDSARSLDVLPEPVAPIQRNGRLPGRVELQASQRGGGF